MQKHLPLLGSLITIRDGLLLSLFLLDKSVEKLLGRNKFTNWRRNVVSANTDLAAFH